jgi:ABC-type transport system involved in cytochrome bd biosynthesis fused ATPase/permease subunit
MLSLRELINVIVPLAIFIAWLVAESRWRTSIRVALGIACMLFPLLWVCATIHTSSTLSSMHATCLHQIDALLRAQQETRILQALQVYEQTYQEERSYKAAVFRLHSALAEPLARDVPGDATEQTEGPRQGGATP